MLLPGEEASISRGEPQVGSYDIWGARKDVDRLAFGYRSVSVALPLELERLQDFLQRLSRDG